MNRVTSKKTLYWRQYPGCEGTLTENREQNSAQKTEESIIIAFSKNKEYPITRVSVEQKDEFSATITINARGEGNHEYVILQTVDALPKSRFIIDQFAF